MNRYFKLELGRYGGEFCMGRVSREFVEYWIDRDECDLMDHVNALEWEENEIDPESPPMREDGTNGAWYEFDDLHHLSSAYSDAGYYLTEIDADGAVIEEVQNLIVDASISQIYGREAYTSALEMLEEHGHEPVPVFMGWSGEKGLFGEVIIETGEEGFDPRLLAASILETDMAEYIEELYYDGKLLDIDYDYCDTTGKSMDYRVGYVAEAWMDKHPSEELLQEMIAEWRENVEWERNNETE